MSGKSTVKQIHLVKQMAEKSHELNKDKYMYCID